MRYKLISKIKDSDTKKERLETVQYPDFPKKPTDKYILTARGNRLDLIAHHFYRNAQLWWVIHLANNLRGGTLNVEPGIRLRIPYPIDTFNFNENFLEAQQ